MLSTEDLLALKAGDLGTVSTEGLMALKGAGGSESTAPSKAYTEGREAPGAVRGLLSVANGPAMGFADEIVGGVGGAWKTLTQSSLTLSDLVLGNKRKTFSENYREVRDYARGAQDYEREANPVFTGVTQMMASAPMMVANPFSKLLGAPAAAAPTNMLTQGARAGGSGAVFGGISGAGNSTAEDFAGVAGDAAKSAAVSGVLSAGAVPVQRAVAGVGGNIAARVNDSAALNQARAKIAEAFVRDGRGSVVQSGASNPILQAQARYDKLGDSAVVADAGGQNTRQLLDTLATLPGKAKSATESLIHTRQAGRAGRMVSAAERSMGTNGERLAPNLARWIDERQTAAAPLYDRLYRVQVQPDRALTELVEAADQLGVTRTARDMATADRIQFSLDPRSTQPFSMRDLDLVKQALDTKIASKVDKLNGGLTPEGASLMRLKAALIDKLDEVTTGQGGSLYRQAREAFAGPSALMDAARSGRTAMQKDGVAIGEMLDGLSASELQAFRVGAFESLRTKLGREGGQTEILKMWKEPATSEKLRAMFGNGQAFRSFAAEAAKEGRLKALESVGRGSQTAARQYGAGDLDVAALAEAGQAASSASSGNVLGMLSAAGNAWNRVSTPEPVRNKLSEILLSGGQTGRNELSSLVGLTQRINADRARLADQAGMLFGQQTGNFRGAGQ
ncbi:hypothetical protein [Hydrogenophaga sp. RAC07]|uniref:hypothetical protein n=1 Tax=Hydrogenophaga sp. RAC07 TaxID=1842537 RepID=UPI0012EA60F1|nr:hypothetical protein [Hydrogenophaga sp. RAC07]